MLHFTPKLAGFRKPFRKSSGFSLVEVVLALGIAVFVLLAITGMLPVGLKLVGDSQDESKAVNVLSAVAADRLSSSSSVVSAIYNLPALGNSSVGSSNSFGVKETGQYVGTDWAQARYRVSYIIRPKDPSRLDPWLITLRVAWPAASTNSLNSVETVLAIPQ